MSLHDRLSHRSDQITNGVDLVIPSKNRHRGVAHEADVALPLVDSGRDAALRGHLRYEGLRLLGVGAEERAEVLEGDGGVNFGRGDDVVARDGEIEGGGG